MKFTTKICIAALATSAAFPVIAQRIPVGGSSTNTKAPDNARMQETGEQTSTTTAATSTTGRKLDISKGAQKAIVDLQTAVNANDTATIPAKLAAAQAVAKTNDDKFAIASNQTRAALKANDLVAIRAGTDALQASGAAETPDLVARYTDLGRRYKEAKQVDEAVVVLNKAMALNPNNVSTLVNLASIRDAQGQKAEAVGLMQKSFIASKASGQKVEVQFQVRHRPRLWPTPAGRQRSRAAVGRGLPVAGQLARFAAHLPRSQQADANPADRSVAPRSRGQCVERRDRLFCARQRLGQRRQAGRSQDPAGRGEDRTQCRFDQARLH